MTGMMITCVAQGSGAGAEWNLAMDGGEIFEIQGVSPYQWGYSLYVEDQRVVQQRQGPPTASDKAFYGDATHSAAVTAAEAAATSVGTGGRAAGGASAADGSSGGYYA